MTKEIAPEFKNLSNQNEMRYSAMSKDKYIDKGNLTSRECGRLVKDMVEDFENEYWING